MPILSVLTIAATDPSGGAGIQADLRVFAAHHLGGASVVTAVTAQNSHGVQSVISLPPGAVTAQLEAILGDISCGAVKIGLLPSAQVIQEVASALRRFNPPRVTLDPVAASSGGVRFLDESALNALRSLLLPLCHLVTPNLDEAEALSGIKPVSLEARWSAAEAIQALGARAVLVKGGHMDGDPQDLLLDEQGRRTLFGGARILTPHTHGTGCFLSAAIAARLALGVNLAAAVEGARGMLEEGLRRPILIGTGRGSPDPSAARSSAAPSAEAADAHRRLQEKVRGIYVLTDPTLQQGITDEEVAASAFRGGAGVVQLRDESSATPDLVRKARALQEIARAHDRVFIVNDRVDVALAADADGVHLGPDDMRPEDARALLGPYKLIGVSVGTVEEALRLAPVASYFGVGAIYGSKTKTDAGDPVGVDRIRQIRSAAPNLPVIAIGGISPENITEVARSHAAGAAVISAVVGQPNMEAATRGLVDLWDTPASP